MTREPARLLAAQVVAVPVTGRSLLLDDALAVTSVLWGADHRRMALRRLHAVAEGRAALPQQEHVRLGPPAWVVSGRKDAADLLSGESKAVLDGWQWPRAAVAAMTGSRTRPRQSRQGRGFTV